MENLINRLVIRNFKSIQHIDMPCKRVNVFIGEPNVGKSNILEAIGLLGFGYSQNQEKYLSDLIRYESLGDLFFEKQKNRLVSITTDIGGGVFWQNNHDYYLLISPSYTDEVDFADMSEYDEHKKTLIPEGIKMFENFKFLFNQNIRNAKAVNDIYGKMRGRAIDHILENISKSYPSKFLGSHAIILNHIDINKISSYESIVKKYEFIKNAPKNSEIYDFLRPPYGDNLFSIIANNKEIWKEAKDKFEKYKLSLVYKQHENIFEIQKNVDGFVTDYPYENMADTLQRIIFYLTAIESNKNSVLVFEEPEAHAFPPYTAELADRIALDDENQYFLTTHSPYLLNTLLSALGEDELNLVLVYYEDYETKVKTLTQEEIKEAISDNFNLFFNLNKFLYAKEELHD